MLFCFMTVFLFSVLFIMFQNSLSRPAIETLVTETHKQINNFKNFKVKENPEAGRDRDDTQHGPFPPPDPLIQTQMGDVLFFSKW